MVLTFTMKINKSDADGAVTSLQRAVAFPVDGDSANGTGNIEVTAKATNKLVADRWYQYDFQLVSGANKYTIGIGRVFVKERVRIA